MQVQCPNCGGYKVDTEVKTHEQGTNVELDRRLGVVPLILGALGIPCSLLFLIAMFTPDISGSIDVAWDSVLGGVGGLILAGFLVFVGVAVLRKIARSEKVQRHHNICQLCGYAWVWTPGDPLPVVTERPDLIAAGLQRLAKEAEEEEKRKKAAAELWYTQHGQK